eukprot:TRINITY_DN2948_c0_g1_i1.p3 TRINITY_DN2948_c0_g1~~TRINITY_DN2948_c0_g1_i1.p3  ORF type:complete len:68 (+),score=21.51 TRINITY_DN2948_c0_g1_i1:360-563(+)
MDPKADNPMFERFLKNNAEFIKSVTSNANKRTKVPTTTPWEAGSSPPYCCGCTRMAARLRLPRHTRG